MKATWNDTGKELTSKELIDEGINNERIPTENYQASLDRIKTAWK